MTSNEKIVYIDGKGFNILEVDDQLLKDLFGQLIKECRNFRWCPTKEEIEEICCETYKRRLYELNTIYKHRKNLMSEWNTWNYAVDYFNNNVYYGKSAFETTINDQYIGGIHNIAVDPSNSWETITINPNSLIYPNSGITYNTQEFDRLHSVVENLWENWQYAEPRHADFQSLNNLDGDITHRYSFNVENITFGATTAVDVRIRTGNVNIPYGMVDRFYVRLQNYIYEYVQICDLDELIRLHMVIWENGTMMIYDIYGQIVFTLNDINMEV